MTAPSQIPGAAFRRGTVSAGEFTLDYAAAGPADAQVTVVSLPGSAGLEMSVAKDRLAGEYRVIEINPPGFGGKTDLNRPMAFSELGEILSQAAASLVPGPFVLIGTSVGGVNALYVASRAAGRVRGIVLEGAMAPTRPQDVKVPPVPGGAGPVNYPLPPVNPKKPWATQEYIARQMADRAALFRWITPGDNPATALAAVRDEAIPVLALVGDEDEILFPTVEQAVRQELPQADFRLVPGGSHDLQNTVPDAFVQLVSEFIGGLKAGEA